MKKLFYIEKEIFLRIFFAETLGPQGIDVFSIDHLDCLYLIRDLEPDLLLVDRKILNNNNFGLLEDIRKERGLSSLPIGVLGFPEELASLVLEGGNKLFNGYLYKPIDSVDLKERLEKIRVI